MATSSRMNTPLGRAQQNLQSSGNYAQGTGGPVRDYQILQNTPFGAMGLANRAATPVGRSKMDPNRIAEMMSRGRATFGQIAGARFLQNFQQNAIGNQLSERQMQAQEQHYADQKAARDKEVADKKAFYDATINNMRRRPKFGQPSSGVSGVPAPAAPTQNVAGVPSGLTITSTPMPTGINTQPETPPSLFDSTNITLDANKRYPSGQPLPLPTGDSGVPPTMGLSGVAPAQAPATPAPTLSGTTPQTPTTPSNTNTTQPEEDTNERLIRAFEQDSEARLTAHKQTIEKKYSKLLTGSPSLNEVSEAYVAAAQAMWEAQLKLDELPSAKEIDGEMYSTYYDDDVTALREQVAMLDAELIFLRPIWDKAEKNIDSTKPIGDPLFMTEQPVNQ
jgi:hypothetical protein